MKLALAVIVFLVLTISVLAGEIQHHDEGPPPNVECRTSTWSPPWNRKHCKDHEGMWVNGKCENPEWVLLECRVR